MSLNWKEIDLILEELPLANSSIQKIRQPDFRTLILDLYIPKRRFSLLISLAQGRTRLHSIERPVKNQVSLQRFAQMLRARIKGGRIITAGQIGKERIIRIDIKRGGEGTILFLRLWGGAGNIIATDDQYTILDAFYRRPKRGEVSGESFHPEELIQKAASGKTGVQRVFEIRPYSPEEGFNRTVEREYLNIQQSEQLEHLEKKARDLIEKQQVLFEQKKLELSSETEQGIQNERYREIGDILMANLHSIRNGCERVKLSDFYHEGSSIEIELDPLLSAHQNAERYYLRHRKESRKHERIREELKNLEASCRNLEQENERLFSQEDPAERIEALSRFLEAYSPGKAGDEKKKIIPGLRFRSGPFTILVGRTARENDSLLRRYVRGNDYWIHTRDFPGGYVFIKSISGKTIPLETLLDAGNLALHYSKGRSSGRGEMYYTQVKYLRRAKEGKLGLVIPTHEKNLSVTLDENRIHHLFSTAQM